MTQKVVFDTRRIGNASSRLTFIKNFTYEVNPTYKRQLVSQPCVLIRSQEINYLLTGVTADIGGDNTGMNTADSDPSGLFALNVPSSLPAGVYNGAYGKFMSKIRDSDSALGVSLGSYKETHGMLEDRSRKMTELWDRIISNKKVKGLSKADFLQLSFTGKGGKKATKYVADNHLEFVFGWLPLFKDMVETTKTLSNLTIPDTWVTASKRTVFTSSREAGVISGGQGQTRYSADGYYRVTLGALVKVTNPHLYLANRLGIANLPGVAWDLVPWSFVVNMFGNFNSIISSFTDMAGLAYSNTSRTETLKGIGVQQFVAGTQHVNPNLYGYASAFHYKKTRVVGQTFPRPSLVLRLPSVSGGLIGIASALSVQQVSRLGSLLR